MTTISYMCFNVRGFMRNAVYPKDYIRMFKQDAGIYCTAHGEAGRPAYTIVQ